MMNRFIDNWSETEYHDQTKAIKPAFSYTTAKTIWAKSPKHAYLAHPRLGGQKRDPSAAMDFGSAVHSSILGKGARYIKSEYDDFRTKEAKEWRDSLPANMIVLKPDDWQRLNEINDAFWQQMDEFGLSLIFKCSDKEVIAEYEYEGVYTLSMFDAWNDDLPVIWDLKTTTDASPKAIQRKIQEMGYDIQCSLYKKAAEIVRPDLAGRVRFIFLFVEIEPPYSLTPVELDGIGDAIGESKLNYSLNKWRDCLSTGKWPGHVNGVITLDTPAWAAKEVEQRA